MNNDDDDDDDEIAYFSVRWKKLENYSLVYCTKTKNWNRRTEQKQKTAQLAEEVSPLCLWWEIYGAKDLPKNKFWVYRERKTEEAMDGGSGEEKDGSR